MKRIVHQVETLKRCSRLAFARALEIQSAVGSTLHLHNLQSGKQGEGVGVRACVFVCVCVSVSNKKQQATDLNTGTFSTQFLGILQPLWL